MEGGVAADDVAPPRLKSLRELINPLPMCVRRNPINPVPNMVEGATKAEAPQASEANTVQ